MQTPDDVAALFASASPAVTEIAERARSVVIETLPGTIEQVDVPARLVGYGRDRTYRGLICAVALQPRWVNLMFARGTELADAEGLLQGTGKRARHVRLDTPDVVERPAVRRLLEAAAALTPE